MVSRVSVTGNNNIIFYYRSFFVNVLIFQLRVIYLNELIIFVMQEIEVYEQK